MASTADRRPSKSKLLGLSLELHIAIAEFLPLWDRLNLTLTCKALQDAVELILYQEYTEHSPLKSLKPFLELLCNRPYLAERFRKVELMASGNIGIGNINGARLEPLTRREYALFAEAAKAAGVLKSVSPYDTCLTKTEVKHDASLAKRFTTISEDDDASWDYLFCKLLRLGCEATYVLVIVALLHNVQEYYLHYEPSAITQKVPRHGFRNLEKVVTWCAKVKEILPFLRFEGIESLQIDSCEEWWYEYESGKLIEEIPALSKKTLTSVSLEGVIIDRRNLEALFSLCHGLKSFRIWSGLDFEFQLQYSVLASEIIDLLLDHRETLKELQVVFSEKQAIKDAVTPAKSLADFKVLEMLCMAALIILPETSSQTPPTQMPPPSHRLPNSLKSLRLYCTESESLESFVPAIMSSTPERLPHLTNFDVLTEKQEYERDSNMEKIMTSWQESGESNHGRTFKIIHENLPVELFSSWPSRSHHRAIWRDDRYAMS